MKAFQFKITLTYTDDPVVWRRLVVPEDISFDEFHLAIQSVFGWDFSHLYQFSAKGWDRSLITSCLATGQKMTMICGTAKNT
jgi:hypothetical protein